MTDIVTVRFTSKWPPNPTSPVIARLAGSTLFSHSMNIIDGKVYEATMLHGCRVVDLSVAMQGVAVYQDMHVPVSDIAAAVKFGQDQDGKPYDYSGAFGIPFLMSEDWSDDSRWWCSEHNFMQILAGGTTPLDPQYHKRVRPIDLLMCNYEKSPLVRLR